MAVVDQSLSLLALTSGLALLAGTIRSIKQNLIRRPADQARLFLAGCVELFEVLLWASCFLALIAAAPHPVVVVIVAMILVSIATAIRLRYREERQCLSRWLRMSTGIHASLSGLIESVAAGCRSRLARQAKACTRRLNRGESLVDAARRARLPLDAATVGAIVLPTTSGDSLPTTSSRYPEGESGIRVRREHERWRSNTLVIHQFSYVLVTMVLAWLIGRLVRLFIFSYLEDVFGEFDSPKELSHPGLDALVLVGDVVVAVMGIWLVLALSIRWLPPAIVPWVPWFGKRSTDQWRCEVLGTLACSMRAGQPVSDTLDRAIKVMRGWWIHSRCRVVRLSVESGTPLVVALKRGRLVTDREQKWLTFAETNGTLPDALDRLCDDIKRRQAHRWRIRMAWVVPLGTVSVGLFVLAHATFLFRLFGVLIAKMT